VEIAVNQMNKHMELATESRIHGFCMAEVESFLRSVWRAGRYVNGESAHC
jgi:hypothetical protein